MTILESVRSSRKKVASKQPDWWPDDDAPVHLKVAALIRMLNDSGHDVATRDGEFPAKTKDQTVS